MARYAIGDIQGCFTEFSALLKKVHFNPNNDQLFSVGDIVNRGPHSLEVLRWMYQHRHAVHMVLGNHDLHLLAVSVGAVKKRSQDTIEAILQAKDRDILLAWLRHQPLFSVFAGFCLVHAGVWPGWNVDEAQRLGREAELALQADNYREFFQNLYGDAPNVWSADLQGIDRVRFIINSMTRMRALAYLDKSLDFQFKGLPSECPADLAPWYDFPPHPTMPRIICGHWSAVGLRLSSRVWCVDTGCAWGKQLSLVNCDTGEVFQQAAMTSAVD